MNHTHNNSLRSMVMSAAMTALAPLLPMAFHAAGLGSYFLPMLLPLLLNGLLSTLPWAVLAGTASLLYRLLNRRIWPALLAAITADRVISFPLTWAMAARFGISPRIAAFGTFVAALPGVALQIAVVPLVLRALRKRTSILIDAENYG
jgi:uncharacterized membrane protein YjjP (DUF1212 family)